MTFCFRLNDVHVVIVVVEKASSFKIARKVVVVTAVTQLILHSNKSGFQFCKDEISCLK